MIVIINTKRKFHTDFAGILLLHDKIMLKLHINRKLLGLIAKFSGQRINGC